jgi:hypothetical protein
MGCGKEESVSITLVTQPREGQEITDNHVQLVAGQAVGVRVVALRDEEEREDWSIEVRSENPGVLTVRPGIEEDVYVLTGAGAGRTDLRFLLDSRFEVFVDVQVVARPDFEPTVSPVEFGGAGGE